MTEQIVSISREPVLQSQSFQKMGFPFNAMTRCRIDSESIPVHTTAVAKDKGGLELYHRKNATNYFLATQSQYASKAERSFVSASCSHHCGCNQFFEAVVVQTCCMPIGRHRQVQLEVDQIF